MKWTTAAIDRILTALAGAALLLGGVSLIAWWLEIPAARTLYAHADRNWYLTAAHHNWWHWALALGAVGSLVAGVLLLLANLRPNRLGTIDLDDRATVNAGALANAVAAAIVAQHPSVRSAAGRALLDRGVRTLRITLTADADTPLDQLRRHAAEAVTDITTATKESAPEVMFFVQLLPVEVGG